MSYVVKVTGPKASGFADTVGSKAVRKSQSHGAHYETLKEAQRAAAGWRKLCPRAKVDVLEVERSAYVELEWADDRDPGAEQHAALYGVTALVVNSASPLHGHWPLIRFTGPLSVVAQLEANYWDGEFNGTEIVVL